MGTGYGLQVRVVRVVRVRGTWGSRGTIDWVSEVERSGVGWGEK
jgi:hypothetical protein